MKLAYTAILAVLLLSGAPALAQIHNGTDGVTPGVKVPDPNAPGTLRSGNGPMYGTPGSTTGSGRMGDTVPPPASSGTRQ